MLQYAEIRFYEELNDFLPPEKRKKSYMVRISERQSVKDLIESENVPHTEIDMILVNGVSVDFSRQVQRGDKISVYPVFELLDVSEISKLRPEPLRDPLFILDVHLGKLARYLRIAGFDTLYSNSYEDSEISAIAFAESRIVLTRDRGILKRSAVKRGYWIRSQNPQEQLKEVIGKFSLKKKLKPLTICPSCNGKLACIEKSRIEHRLPVKTALYYNDFSICPVCGKIYWRGSHFRIIEKILQESIV